MSKEGYIPAQHTSEASMTKVIKASKPAQTLLKERERSRGYCCELAGLSNPHKYFDFPETHTNLCKNDRVLHPEKYLKWYM